MVIVGICGASGSGKTTLAEALAARFPGQATLIHQDAYYRDHSHLSLAQRERLNYDHPDIFDHDLLYQDLKALADGRAILSKGYDYARHVRSDPMEKIEPRGVLIFEGIHAFYDERVRGLMDVRLFMQVDPDICLLRRIQRDITERGRDIDSIARQYLETVRPMYQAYVRGYKEYADMIVTQGGKNRRALDVLARYIRAGQDFLPSAGPF